MTGVTARPMTRVRVVGASGSGKSRLARELAAALEIPRFDLDRMFMEPGWVPVADAVAEQRVAQALAESEAWVMDGNWSGWAAPAWDAADAIVWVDLPAPVTLWQLLRRTVRRIVSREEVWPGSGCYETWGKAFASRESILLYSARSAGKFRRRYSAEFARLAAERPDVTLVRLGTRGEVGAFIASLQRA